MEKCDTAMRTRSIMPGLAVLGLVAVLAPLGATTLLQLSLDDMIKQSTGIVRATVSGTRTDYRGADIYTYYQLQVLETLNASTLTPSGLKPALAQMEVAVPGGAARGVRQTVAGAPSLQVGQQYVVFLWTSRSGLTQVIGLSQGLFLVQTDAAGNLVLIRPSASEPMVNSSGQGVPSQALSLSLAAVRSQVIKTLGVAQ